MDRVSGKDWIKRVHELLKDGYGVEDISILLGCSVESVRSELSVLRRIGALSRMFRRAI